MTFPVHVPPLIVARAEDEGALLIDARQRPPEKHLSDDVSEEVQKRKLGAEDDRRRTIGLPRLAASRDKLKESMLAYTRKMAEYKRTSGLYLQGSAAVDDQGAFGSPTRSTRQSAEVRRREPGRRAEHSKTTLGDGERRPRKNRSRRAESGDAAASPTTDHVGKEHSLAYNLTNAMANGALTIEVAGKSLTRRVLAPSGRPPNFERGALPDRAESQRRSAVLLIPSVGKSADNDDAANTAGRPASGVSPLESSDYDDETSKAGIDQRRLPGEWRGAADGGDDRRVFEVIQQSGSSLKFWLSLSAGRRAARTKRMKMPKPLLSSIVEDDQEYRVDVAELRTVTRSSVQRLLDSVTESGTSPPDSYMDARLMKDKQRSMLLRVANAAGVPSHDMSKYMTSHARRKLQRLPALEGVQTNANLGAGRHASKV